MSKLHHSAENGDLQAVKQLIEHDEYDPQEKDKKHFDYTPLHHASRRGHLHVVQYLTDDQQCDINCQDVDGDTPLHEACWEGHISVVKYLVANKDCDAKCINKHGMAPLHKASRSGHLLVIKCLVDSKQCDVDHEDNEGNTPLHWACQFNKLPVVEYLVDEKRCDVNCTNNEGRTPLWVASRKDYYDIIKVLLDHGADPDLLYDKTLKKKSPACPGEAIAKIFIIGHPHSGKSTLSETLFSVSTSTWSQFWNRYMEVSGVKQNTAGIIYREIECEPFGPIHIYDFAGHEEFYASHDAMMRDVVVHSTGVFLVLADLQKNKKDYEQSMMYWLSFIKNQATFMKTKPHVLLLGTHEDKVSRQVKDSRQVDISLLWRQSTFSCLDIRCYFEIDCRFSESASMTQLRDALTENIKEMQTSVVENFAYHSFFIFLEERFAKYSNVQLSKVMAVLATETKNLYKYLPTNISELDALCQSLDSHGRVLYLRCGDCLSQSWIINDRHSLLTRVNGTIFAPKDFTEHSSTLASSTGVVQQSTLTSHFPDLPTDLVALYLTHFEFCRQISDPITLQYILSLREQASGEPFYFFPALVCVDRPKQVWEPSDQFSYYSGWLLQCTQPEDFFTSRLLQAIILRISFDLALPCKVSDVKEQPAIHRQCKIWKNGVYWSQLTGAGGMLEITSKQVVVLVRSLCGNEMAAVELRSTVIHMVLDAQKEFCAGISPSESMICPGDAAQFPASDLELFSCSVISQAVVKAEPYVVGTKDSQLELKTLLHFEPYAFLGESYLHDLLRNSEGVEIRTLVSSIKDRFCSDSPQSPSSKFMCFLDQGSITCQDLRSHFDKYSIYAGRNVLNLTPVCLEHEAKSSTVVESVVHHLEYECTSSPSIVQEQFAGQESHELRHLNPHLNVKDLMNALNKVPNWEMLGCKLDVKEYKIKEIAVGRNYREPSLCKMDLLYYWLRNDVEASWERVAEALDDMDEKAVASEIRAAYCHSDNTVIETDHISHPVTAEGDESGCLESQQGEQYIGVTTTESHMNLTSDDLLSVSSHLLHLSQREIWSLGLVLGLYPSTLLPIRESDTFLDDMLLAWLNGVDNVASMGGSNWMALVKGLRDQRLKLYELAETIENIKHC